MGWNYFPLIKVAEKIVHLINFKLVLKRKALVTFRYKIY